jgi:hypothetical protein
VAFINHVLLFTKGCCVTDFKIKISQQLIMIRRSFFCLPDGELAIRFAGGGVVAERRELAGVT